MNGASPDPAKSAPAPDTVARLKLTQALQRAQYAIAWERIWPGLARVLTVIGLFLVASWAGLWLALPFPARVVGIGLFILLALGAAFPLLKFRWPSREVALGRLDRGTGVRHRPATALTDTLQSNDPIAQALAQDLDRLEALRRGLRARIEASPLRDERGFAADLEAAYREMWRSWCAAQRPALSG